MDKAMKLSEILPDFPVKAGTVIELSFEGVRKALAACDREVDREALAKIIHFEIYKKDMTEETPVRNLSIYGIANAIISTMPTWLKRSEG